MLGITTTPSLEQLSASVKSPSFNATEIPSNVLIHHKPPRDKKDKLKLICTGDRWKTYGVSKTYRVLSPSLLIKKYDYVKDCLRVVIGLTPGQREAVVRLLRFWAYYGCVYPKAEQLTDKPDWGYWPALHSSGPNTGRPIRSYGCSKATFWRAVRILQDEGLIEVVNRFIIRPHAQISNLYRLEKLIIVIAKYLAEHMGHIWPEWLEPYLRVPWPQFWAFLAQGPEIRAGPAG